MDNTYPYPTATEVEDIKAVFDFLFDSISFKSHDENYELYSASTAENINEPVKKSKLLFARKLNSEQIYDDILNHVERHEIFTRGC